MFSCRSLPVFAAAAAAALAAVASPPAIANIVKDTSITALLPGFSAVPMLLTVHANGTEYACNKDNGAGVLVQTCKTTDASVQGNGSVNGTGSNGNESPASDTTMNNLVNLAALGITDATQIRLLYDPSENGSNPQTNIKDITLKFYNASHTEVVSIDGGCGNNCQDNATDPLYFSNDTGTNFGNGGVGFILTVDATQAAAVNTACGVSLVGCITVAGESTINLANGGGDSYRLFSRSLPEPASLALLGTALAGFGILLRRRRSA